MKKLHLASAALVLSAGVASAQGVTLSGDARMGLIYDGNDVLMTSRARVAFTLSGETDGGLAFGASFRADQAGAAGTQPGTLGTRMTAGTVFISGDFGKLTMGDVDTAARAAAGDLYGVGLTGLGDLNEVAYLDRAYDALFGGGLYTGGAYQTGALYEYSIDGFSGYVGLGQNNVVRLPGVTVRDMMASIGAKFSFDGLTAAVGYEYARASATSFPSFTASHLVGSVEYEMDGFKGKVHAGRVGSDLATLLTGPNSSRTQFGASVEGTFDATTVTVFAHRTFFKENNFGVGVSYDLGGGASINSGVVRHGSSAFLGTGRSTTADFGLAFTF